MTNAIFDRARPVLITGGAGFIGTNLADRLLCAGQPVIVYDSLARAGTEANLMWLRRKHPTRLEVVIADIRDAATLARVVRRSCRVFHLAAQVAVTTSLDDPAADFTVNAWGTLNVLEAIRATPQPPPLLFTSTNKVYGTLGGMPVTQQDGRYVPESSAVRARGIGEEQPLDFHSPYGCSKGAADQYVLDYARVFGLEAVVFRMSCIYGPHQCGNEDQGWVAHFIRQALARRALTIYGDGRQVRDALHADDLIDAMLRAHARIRSIKGRAFNIGGGVSNAISLLDLLAMLERHVGQTPKVRFGLWRPADQKYYVSSIEAFAGETGWRPQVPVEDGVRRLVAVMRQSAAADELAPAAGDGRTGTAAAAAAAGGQS